jgi:hypothetical protein
MESIPPPVRMESRRPTSPISRNELRYSERKLYHSMMENAYKELEIAIAAISLFKVLSASSLTNNLSP